jgi:hypothetical protein
LEAISLVMLPASTSTSGSSAAIVVPEPSSDPVASPAAVVTVVEGSGAATVVPSGDSSPGSSLETVVADVGEIGFVLFGALVVAVVATVALVLVGVTAAVGDVVLGDLVVDVVAVVATVVVVVGLVVVVVAGGFVVVLCGLVVEVVSDGFVVEDELEEPGFRGGRRVLATVTLLAAMDRVGSHEKGKQCHEPENSRKPQRPPKCERQCAVPPLRLAPCRLPQDECAQWRDPHLLTCGTVHAGPRGKAFGPSFGPLWLEIGRSTYVGRQVPGTQYWGTRNFGRLRRCVLAPRRGRKEQ